MKGEIQILDIECFIENTIKSAISAIITANMIAIYLTPILIINVKALIIFALITLPFFTIKVYRIAKGISDNIYEYFHGAFIKLKHL